MNAAGRSGRGLMANDDAVDLRPVLFSSCCCVNEVVPAQCRAIARGDEAELMEQLRVHIIDANEVLDHDAFIRSRRG